MGNYLRIALSFFLIHSVAVDVVAQAPAQAKSSVQVAAGVVYQSETSKSPEGLPWSYHVLRIERKNKEIRVRAASAAREMRRELPTAIALQEVRAKEELLAVVNGDYDIAAPYLGISDGLSITSGHLWTTGRATWPVFALRKNGEPLIGVPEIKMELRAGKSAWSIAALNKPLGSVHGAGARVYTRDFRAKVTSDRTFRAIVIGKLSRKLPLAANTKVRGEIVQVAESVKEMAIPEEGIVVAERVGARNAGEASAQGGNFASSTLSVGSRVELRIDVQVGGRRDVRDVIGGFPIVTQGGVRRVVGEPGANLRLRHPRTAVCYNEREIIFTVVDGRQPQLSVGMTLEELGDLMVSLGCKETMNTDGGGSSVMAIATAPRAGAAAETTATRADEAQRAAPLRIVNSPSDGKERGRGNAWVILRR